MTEPNPEPSCLSAARQPGEEGEVVVEVRNVTFSYDGTPVVEDADCTIRENSFVGIVGPNGGGKTTLVKLMLGLIEPDEGSVRVFGRDPHQVRHKVGYVPQYFRFDPEFPVLVKDVVLMGRLGLGLQLGPFGRQDKEAAVRALSEVGMEGLEKRRFASLSGGQQQRVLIARALVSRPEILFLDEPTANIDAAVEKELSLLLQELNQQMTIVMVTHHATFVGSYIRKVICVNRKVVQHPTGEVCDENMRALMGEDVRLVLHGHSETEGLECPSS